MSCDKHWFGKFLKYLRNEYGWTQEQTRKVLGFDYHMQYFRLEHGQSMVTLEIMEKVRRAFGFSTLALMVERYECFEPRPMCRDIEEADHD